MFSEHFDDLSLNAREEIVQTADEKDAPEPLSLACPFDGGNDSRFVPR
jgi:hypothetical protein